MPRAKDQGRRRIFDHLEGAPWDAPFSRVAWEMVRSPSWRAIPVYVEPPPVSGEIEVAPDPRQDGSS